MTRRTSRDWEDGTDRLRIAEQYAGRPRYGLVFRVEQRTVLNGRDVLLDPDRVAEVHSFLGDWLDAQGFAS